MPALPTAQRPEVLAPAGDRACLEAAVEAGADAVYFGLDPFNARARAQNFSADSLAETMQYLRAHATRGYVALNTLVFDDELARAVSPELPIHASTQMTCTDANALQLARELGASRVILPRELSLEEIEGLAKSSPLELEVFVRGALCVAYSGQCLTSEAIGDRSANSSRARPSSSSARAPWRSRRPPGWGGQASVAIGGNGGPEAGMEGWHVARCSALRWSMRRPHRQSAADVPTATSDIARSRRFFTS